MKNKVLLIFLAIVLVVSLAAFAACKAEEEPPVVEEEEPPPVVEEEEEPPPPPYEWPKDFKIATHGIGASDYAQMTSIAPMIEQSTGMKVRVVPEDISALKSRWLVQGLFDTKSDSANEVGTYNIQAQSAYATRDGGPFQTRAIIQTFFQAFGIMVRGDSEIRTVYDIKPGTKMSVWTMPGGLELVTAVLAWANLTPDDVVLVETGSYPDNMRMVADGRADVSCLALPSSTVIQELEAGPHGLHWLDLNSKEDPEGAARYNSIMPATIFSPIAIGVESSIGHWGWGGPSLLWTTADTDPELIYNLVKWLDENFDSYKDLHPNNADMSLDRFRGSLDFMYLPIHEGTIKYLKEKGMWTAEDDVRQAYNVDLVTRYCEAYQEAIDLADAAGITVAPDSEEWMELWENYKKDLGLPVFKVIYEF